MDVDKYLSEFTPKHDFFIGIDSDGCVMDVMDLKHQECFTPAYIKYFNLQAIGNYVRETAIFVNLYSQTRGQNRWITLDMIFDRLRHRPEVLQRGVKLPEGKDLKAFLASGLPLSNGGVEAFLQDHPSAELEQCLEWSNGVNKLADWMVANCQTFPGARKALATACQSADLVTISSANLGALQKEWHEQEVDIYMSLIAGQEMGTKAQQVAKVTAGKYQADHCLLLGDSPSDLSSAREAGVLFYPIMPGKEVWSWENFKDEALPRFLNGEYSGAYQDSLIEQFSKILPTNPPWEEPTIP